MKRSDFPRHAKRARAADDAAVIATLDRFMGSYSVDNPSTGRACIDRLRGHRCTRYRDDDELHHIPHHDHTGLWLRDGEPTVYTAHLYDCNERERQDIRDFAEEHNLRADISTELSWYWPGDTTLVAIVWEG